MNFQQSKPKRVKPIQSLWQIITALVYQDIKTSSGNFTGSLLYKFIRPIIFTLLIAFILRAFRGGYTIEESIRFLFINFLIFFFLLEQISRSTTLTSKIDLLNLPKVSFLSILLSQSIGSIAIFFPQFCFGVFLYFVFMDEVQIFNYIQLFFFSWAVGVVYYVNMSLILFNNNGLIQLHDFLQRSLVFLSAIFYSIEIIPEAYRSFFLLNPIAHLMEYIRHINGWPSQSFFSLEYIIGFIVVGIVIFPIFYFFRIHLIFYGKLK